MLYRNNDAKHDDAKGSGESDGLFGEILQIYADYEMLILSEEIVISEWVGIEVVAARVRVRRKARLPEIDFTHIEVEEELPPGTIEKVEGILAESLFRAWLVEKGVGSD